MLFTPDSPIFQGASLYAPFHSTVVPVAYTGMKDEYLAGRSAAWLGVALNFSPVFDVKGPDAVRFLNWVAVNKDFGNFPEGMSKHVLICNEEGYMLADGVVIKVAENHFRTYWLAPVIHYFLSTSGMNIEGEYVTDEYFFQIDGPKSLEIVERATGADLHDLKFARNKRIDFDGHEAVVHRLGMSGALAYEMHGNAENAVEAYKKLRATVEEFGGKVQGVFNYPVVNHTVAGYPNQYLHYIYPVHESGEGLSEFITQTPYLVLTPTGSAADRLTNFYATPYDVNWGYLVNFDHDFIGKAALEKIAANRPRKTVTLEWNPEDIADVVASQYRGTEVEPYDDINHSGLRPEEFAAGTIRGDYVVDGDAKVGVATGRTIAYHERKMVSLASISTELAVEGRELEVLWGDLGHPVKRVRVKVARFPYYNGPYRNEKFDTSNIPRLVH
ncbi:hypothetical protein [Nocardia sp. CA-120079]|uniref:hypothetical protein n=1 Tax=Nocardia sp. CA-120079 TaxID=3239974 RepID=UPI003D977F24